MKKKQTVSRGLVAIHCACAVIWNINLFMDLAYGYSDRGTFILHIVCAVLWDICAAAWILRYRKEKQKSASEENET